MSLTEQKSRFQALASWFQTEQGSAIAAAFAAELKPLNELLYGENLLQLGYFGMNSWLEGLRYAHKWFVSPYKNPAVTVVSSLNQLPLARNSIDCVVAPLIMEGFSQQKHPLDEIDRILKPMGFAVFFGINPLSLWGLGVRLRRTSCFGPLAAKPKSVFFIQRAMLHRGYLQCNVSAFYYIPPLANQNWLHKFEILNEVGKMISPCPPGFYCLVMQKHLEITPNPILAHQEGILEPSKKLQPACQVHQELDP